MEENEERCGKPEGQSRAVPESDSDHKDNAAERHRVAHESERPGSYEFPWHEPLLAAKRADSAPPQHDAAGSNQRAACHNCDDARESDECRRWRSG